MLRIGRLTVSHFAFEVSCTVPRSIAEVGGPGVGGICKMLVNLIFFSVPVCRFL